MNRLLMWAVVASAFFVVSCGQKTDLDAERAAVQKFHDECFKAQLAGNVDCLAEDGQWLPPKAQPIKGREAIREIVSQAIEDPNFSASHEIVDIEVSGSGDLASIHYNFELTSSAPDGNSVTERGKAIHILKKQPEVGWKILIDIWNADTPEVNSKPINPESEKVAATEAVSKLWSAFRNEDLELLSQVFAHDPGLIFFGTDAAERWVGFESFRAAEEQVFAVWDVDSVSIRDQAVTIHKSAEAGWFSAILDGTVSRNGESISLEGVRITGVLEKRDGDWRIVQYHSSVPVAGQNLEY